MPTYKVSLSRDVHMTEYLDVIVETDSPEEIILMGQAFDEADNLVAHGFLPSVDDIVVDVWEVVDYIDLEKGE